MCRTLRTLGYSPREEVFLVFNSRYSCCSGLFSPFPGCSNLDTGPPNEQKPLKTVQNRQKVKKREQIIEDQQ